MKDFHFSKIYFNLLIYEDEKSKVRVEIDESPSINLNEEEYSLRISTRYEDCRTVHRNYAIEHHLPPNKHCFPHLQFKFHTEEIGQFRLRIDINDDIEYKRAILGFIYKTKEILGDLEKLSKGITSKMMVINLVNKLNKEGDFLSNKIEQGIKKYSLEFDRKRINKESVTKLKENPLLLNFIGSKNLKNIISNHKN
jgi:hypothetical protein